MRINLDWDEILENKKVVKKKVNSIKKKEPEKSKKIRKTSSKSKSLSPIEKISAEFINSINYVHTPGMLSIEIKYSKDNLEESKQGIHVKALNREQIQGLKRFFNIFVD